MTHEHVDADLEYKAELLKAIGHPVRLCIVKNLLFGGTRNVGDMQDCLCIPQSTVSQHLNKLKSAGIITGIRNKNEMLYTLSNDEIKQILLALFENSKEAN